MFQIKLHRISKYTFSLQYPFSENRSVHELMSKNVVPGRQQKAIWRRVERWVMMMLLLLMVIIIITIIIIIKSRNYIKQPYWALHTYCGKY